MPASLVAVLALMLSLVSAVTTARPAAAACPSNYVIGVRGSGESTGPSSPFGMGPTVGAYALEVQARVSSSTTFYSLPYPAAPVGPDYYASVEAGWTALNVLIRSQRSSCPRTHIGLIGYSQGAHVINQALQSLTTAELGSIKSVLLIADPLSAGPSSYHVQTLWTGTGTGSPTLGGILGRQTLPPAIQPRAIDFCIDGDPVCDSSGGSLSLLGDAVRSPLHLIYVECCGTFQFKAILGGILANRLVGSVKGNDYTFDDISDMISVRNTDGCLYQRTGLGNGGFGSPSIVAGCGWTPYRSSLAAPGDLDGDGYGDLLGINAGTGCIVRWLGKGNAFEAGVQLGCGWTPYYGTTVGAGDLNGDGFADLVGINTNTNCIFRWLGDGTGRLGAGVQLGCGWSPYRGTLTGVGDLNGDNIGDLVGINQSTKCIFRWYGNGSGGLGKAVQLGCGWSPYVGGSTLSGMDDINGDGIGDLTAINITNGCLYRWLGNGSGGLGTGQAVSCGWLSDWLAA